MLRNAGISFSSSSSLLPARPKPPNPTRPTEPQVVLGIPGLGAGAAGADAARFAARMAERFPFLHPKRIRDKAGRRPQDQEYDPRTLAIPNATAWFKEMKVCNTSGHAFGCSIHGVCVFWGGGREACCAAPKCTLVLCHAVPVAFGGQWFFGALKTPAPAMCVYTYARITNTTR